MNSQSGEYFVTICTHQRECLFGEIVGGEIKLNPLGLIVQEEWLKTSVIRPEIELDEFVIMPNHLHGIIVIKEINRVISNVGTHYVGTYSRMSLRRKPRSLGAIVAGFKSAATKRINEQRNIPHIPVWQSRFHEHIIRSDRDLDKIWDYIINHPLKWQEDEENSFLITKSKQ